MGIFYEMARVFNRTPVPLTVRFDGQDRTLQPGENLIPKQAVPFGKNQNPIMGSQDPTNPHISGARYLIGEIGVDAPDECAPLTKKEWEQHLGRPCRLDDDAMFEERYGNDPKARRVVHGKGRAKTGRASSSARSRADAGGNAGSGASFERDR